jgi:endonuclease/exonuclease/phosphatase family metal-dependent hydrolase
MVETLLTELVGAPVYEHCDRGDMVRQGDKPRRIDWILLKNGRHRLRTEAHAILRDRDPKPAIYPSDHYPILATLALAN